MYDIIPGPDIEAVLWMRGLADSIERDPARYHLRAEDSQTISAAVSAFDAAFEKAANRATRTGPAIARKTEARRSAERVVREFVATIRGNSAIDECTLLDLGLRRPARERRARPCPRSSPCVHISHATPGVHHLTWADSLRPHVSARPFGAKGLDLHLYVGRHITDDPEAAEHVGTFTRSRLAYEHKRAHDGLMATFFGCWAGARGEKGPYSLGASMRIIDHG